MIYYVQAVEGQKVIKKMKKFKKKIVHVSPYATEGVKVGMVVVLASSEYVGPTNRYAREGDIHYWFGMDPDGIPGNSSGERETEGWRGTTDGWAVYAHCVWRVADIGESRLWYEKPYYSHGSNFWFPGVRKVRIVLAAVGGGADE